jgi:ABC-2 type transport system ATP-binding protein
VLDVVEKVCSRVLVIHEGRLLAQGAPEELKAATCQDTLEDVFRALTGAGETDPGVARIVSALRL